MLELIKEKYSNNRQSPVAYKDIKGDIFNLCCNRWPSVDFDDLFDSFKRELNYQIESFNEDLDRLRFLEFLLEDLISHQSAYDSYYASSSSSSIDNCYSGSSIKPLIVREYIREWEDIAVLNPKKRLKKERSKDSMLLSEIWTGNKKSYEGIIELLLNKDKTGFAFVTKINERLFWNKKTGFAQYIAAFLDTLIAKNYINNQYSAPKLASIVQNTFNIKIDPKPLQSLHNNCPKENYLRPFKSIPNNSNGHP